MRGLWSIVLLALCIRCVEPYYPELISEELNSLVVDGSINSDGSANVILSRSVDMNTSILFSPSEGGATVTIRSSSGEIHPLSEETPEAYIASGLDMDTGDKFTLHIVTSGGAEYSSDEVQINSTPPIDSVYWVVSSDARNIEVRVDAKDKGPNATGFYLWECTETYQYRATMHSQYKFAGTTRHAVERLPEEEIYTCWIDELAPSTFFSTHILTEPTVIGMPIQVIPQYSKKIPIRYGILVRQRAISEGEHFSRSKLKITTENTGSIFAVTPGSVIGNVRSINNPNEYVLGYFSARLSYVWRIYNKTTVLVDDLLCVA